jgi:predicted dehydrogenase
MITMSRRDLMFGAGGLALSPARRARAASDRINVGLIGAGLRGSYLAMVFAKNPACRIAAVCDVYQKRVTLAKQAHKCEGFLDYRELLAKGGVDAVVVATPDHSHARIAIDAMRAGKDVYVEKPLCHTVGEARDMVEAVKATDRVVQIGCQTTSSDRWSKARKLIAEGAIGRMVMTHGSFHRNGLENWMNQPVWPVDPAAGPQAKGDNYVDWKMWLGSAPERRWTPDRFFRYRK